jgi:lysophospholipase L1-like esterase
LKLQKTLQVGALVAASAILFACGGGGGDGATTSGTGGSQSPTNTAGRISTAAASTVTQVIDYYGDSTVWGFASGSLGDRVARPAPVIFAEQLPAAARYVVRNEGVSRTTACQLLQGTDGTHPDWSTQMRNSNAKFVIINHGINDQRSDIGESVPNYKACLTTLAQIARQQGKNVIFETPNPTDQTGSGLDAYVTGMKEVAAAQAVNVIDQHQYLLGQLAGRDARALMPDGTHPSDDTYALKGRFAAAEFLKLSY